MISLGGCVNNTTATKTKLKAAGIDFAMHQPKELIIEGLDITLNPETDTYVIKIDRLVSSNSATTAAQGLREADNWAGLAKVSPDLAGVLQAYIQAQGLPAPEPESSIDLDMPAVERNIESESENESENHVEDISLVEREG